MKMKIIHLLLIITMLWSANGAARNRSTLEMKQIAAKTINLANTQNGTDYFNVVKETNNYAILAGNKGGIVIVAKNVDRDAVLGYSESKYDPNILPCGFQWWLKAMDASLESKRNGPIMKIPVPSELPSSVQPLVPYAWGQRYPYNSMCPNGTLVGCVAVAMGQVIASHNYPNTGEGSHSYYWNGNLLSVNFGETTYNWNAISDGNTSEIAKLLYHCGVATNMNYGYEMSTSYTSLVRDAVVDYFRYKSDAIFVSRNSYSDSQWANLLFGNIARGNAVVYTGDEDSSIGSVGHAFVIDGYDSYGNVHVNWGWTGLYDGYYDLATLQSDYASYGYNQEMVCFIEPAEQQNPDDDNIFLTYDLGDEGKVMLVAEYGNTYLLKVVPDDGYNLETVTYNGNSILSQVENNSIFSTPSIIYNATLKVRTNNPYSSLATSIALNYSELELVAGYSTNLYATILPEQASNQTVAWSSSNSAVATVDHNGKVTAKAIGTTNIKASTTDGTNLSATCVVTVTSNSQGTVTVQVGYGTEQNEVSPVCNWWKSSYCGNECLYTKEDLGLKSGDKIVSLSYNCIRGYANGGNFNVRIKNTPLYCFRGNSEREDISVMEVGYDDTINGNTTLGSYQAGDWITFNLSTPFEYEGENIVIDIRNTAPASRQGWCYFASTAYNSRRMLFWINSNSENVESDGFNTNIDDYGLYQGNSNDNSSIPNVRITYIPASIHMGDVNCDGDVTASDITELYNYLLNGDLTYVNTADVNGDGDITAADVTAVYDILLGN